MPLSNTGPPSPLHFLLPEDPGRVSLALPSRGKPRFPPPADRCKGHPPPPLVVWQRPFVEYPGDPTLLIPPVSFTFVLPFRGIGGCAKHHSYRNLQCRWTVTTAVCFAMSEEPPFFFPWLPSCFNISGNRYFPPLSTFPPPFALTLSPTHPETTGCFRKTFFLQIALRLLFKKKSAPPHFPTP